MKRAVFITRQKMIELQSSFIVARYTTHVTYVMKKQAAVITLSGQLVNITKKPYCAEVADANSLLPNTFKATINVLLVWRILIRVAVYIRNYTSKMK
ncbi:hypothetical protein SporoS204_06430 [Sporosarcina ureae]|uniref:Uncharacterized protein n=1 Tax=Sporosarcina ureae TaxID=1571 RepID=A0ABN4YSV3_SPOUR|nr:hypothetical protein SporoS204_06430 [Sporosarcina ureae]